jgi:hypothetical protein
VAKKRELDRRRPRSRRADQVTRATAGRQDRQYGNLREQHKTMPDRVVKAQALPEMKKACRAVQNAPDREK